MAEDILQEAINEAGLAKAFGVLDLDQLMIQIEQANAQDALFNGSFAKFLEAIIANFTLPATWQKLSDFGWNDSDVIGLQDGNLLTEDGTTLIAAINMGALAISEYNEFANYPNQEVNILYYTKGAQKIIGWLQGKVVLPKISRNAFSSSTSG